MTLALKRTQLLRDSGYIDGQWVQADAGGRFAVTDPATGSTIAMVADMGVDETRRAIDAAARALLQQDEGV